MDELLGCDETDLSQILCIRDKDDRPALRIGLLMTLFIPEAWTRPVREAIAEAAEEYVSQFRSYLRWSRSPEDGLAYGMDEVPAPRDWLPQYPDGEGWFFGFHSGEQKNAAAEFQVYAFGSEKNDAYDDPGCFQVYLPLNWFATHPGTFPEFVLSFAKRLRPASGYAGIGVLEPLSPYDREPFQSTVRQIADRFPGLEIEHLPGHLNHVGEGIKGVNWLTLLGDRWVQQIGGNNYLYMRLGDNFKLTPYDGGLMIQAGPKPQIGDVAANRWPRHYVTLAKVLKPIQIKEHYAFHFGDPNAEGPPRMDSDASEAWLFRFDGK
jgi:Protein of unknown function (DUF3396)